MRKTIKAVKRAWKAAHRAIGPQQYRAHGKPVLCSHCGHDRFTEIPLAVTVPSVITAAPGLKCARCTHIELFAERIEMIELAV